MGEEKRGGGQDVRSFLTTGQRRVKSDSPKREDGQTLSPAAGLQQGIALPVVGSCYPSPDACKILIYRLNAAHKKHGPN